MMALEDGTGSELGQAKVELGFLGAGGPDSECDNKGKT